MKIVGGGWKKGGEWCIKECVDSWWCKECNDRSLIIVIDLDGEDEEEAV